VENVNGFGKMKHYKANINKLKILTPSGYQHFDGIAYMGDKKIYRIELENDKWIECTDDHKIYISDNECIEAKSLKINDEILTLDGLFEVKNAYYTGRVESVYDIIGVSGGNRFYGNDILVSNCKFIAYDETLIDSIFLSNMNLGEEPYNRTGNVRWYSPIEDNKIYIIGLDPSLGTGGDNAAIQIVSLPDLVQVGEWQHNKTSIPAQINIIKQIVDHIKKTAPNSEIYWSVENNSIGEAALITINEMGEENIEGTFLSETKKHNKKRVYRKGFTTTHVSKISACSKLKQWIEQDKLKLKSKNVIRELKNFVSNGTSYKAKIGETDDLIMALLLVVRMIVVISKYDDETFNNVRDTFDEEKEMPMPIGFL
jgi:intein/homing endonuclease